MWSTISIFVIALICLANGQENKEDKARYDNYRMYSVHLKTEEHVKVFQEIEARSDSYIFMGHARQANQNLSILAAAHKIADLTDIMHQFNISYKVLNYNFQANLDAEAVFVKPMNTSVNDFDWRHYYHLETIYAWLDHLCSKYSAIVKPVEIGKSYEGVPIRGVKLSHKENNTAIFIEGGIHAREWISPATATFILDELLISDDKEVQDIAQNFDWIFFPVINPDGYKATFEKDRMWRKTRQPFGICRGTDLNRNFDSAWNKTGSSPDPCAYDYAGPSMNSEPEAEQLSKYLKSIFKSQFVQTYISLHSFSQLLMFPNGYTSEKVDNYVDLKEIGAKTVEAIKKRYGTIYKSGSVYETIYPSAGSSHDFAHSVGIPITYTFELRGPPNSTDWFILPAAQIEPVGWEILDGLVALLKEAKARGYYDYGKIVASQKGSASRIENEEL
ncbi:zinc carboxypeptidase isoform X2 [Contarinia nasturtii]|uniref:zinc carboxypeptidase isoform X2 n=1 Tax=Contarinia nasturtii TaxID=265458 RepID=UPI0012D42375|nr:zinc carboxypeptidase isoform X2 [Contarinia nasturtii]